MTSEPVPPPESGEVPLTGGRVTAGLVRLGDTVRRPRSANADLVRRLLLHLEAAGFDGAPRHLGVDEKGRDILVFIPGEVPADLGHHDDAVLAAAGRLIRRYHDATEPLPGRATGCEVICHNDLSPCNAVFRIGLPVALIDFDAAAPGLRADDLGYAAWLWLDIGNEGYAIEEQRRRLRLFLAAYGPSPAEAGVLRAMLDRQAMLAEEGGRRGDAALRDWAVACRDWTRAAFDP